MRATLSRWLWPGFVVASSLAYVVAFACSAAEEAVLLVPAVQFATLFALEPWLGRERAGSARADPKLGNDLGHNVLGFGLGTALSDAFVWGATALLAAPMADVAGAPLWPRDWPLVFQAALVIFLADGLETLRHRLFHTSLRLWPIHAVHHEGERLHVAKSGRNHCVDLGSRGLFVFAPLALLGAPREALLAYPAAVSVFGPIAHANLELRVAPWLHRWLMTPPVHHIHHARSLALALHNYANVLPLWDRWLGTFCDPCSVEPPPAGLEDDPNPPGFWAQLWTPLAPWRSRA